MKERYFSTKTLHVHDGSVSKLERSVVGLPEFSRWPDTLFDTHENECNEDFQVYAQELFRQRKHFWLVYYVHGGRWIGLVEYHSETVVPTPGSPIVWKLVALRGVNECADVEGTTREILPEPTLALALGRPDCLSCSS